jgi:hydrogenase maturation protease
MPNPDRKIVLGLGNLLNKDEGLGVQAVKLLDARLGPQNGVELLDGGVLGLSLLMLVEECSHLLILDAVDNDQPPGSVIELARDQIPLYTGIKMSQHQITFQEVLGLAKMRDHLPENLHLIGIQPRDLSIGLDLSPEVAQALPQVLRRAAAVLQTWGLIPANQEDETGFAMINSSH